MGKGLESFPWERGNEGAKGTGAHRRIGGEWTIASRMLVRMTARSSSERLPSALRRSSAGRQTEGSEAQGKPSGTRAPGNRGTPHAPGDPRGAAA